MATITQFTSYDEIRATLGVSDEELEDATLALPMYMRDLGFELADIASDVESTYATVAALPGPLTTVQQRFYDAVQLFSTFNVAKQLLTSLPLFAPKSIGDGRADFDRQADPFQDVRDGVLAGLSLARSRVAAAYGTLNSTTLTNCIVAPIFVRSTGIATDPVTGA